MATIALDKLHACVLKSFDSQWNGGCAAPNSNQACD